MPLYDDPAEDGENAERHDAGRDHRDRLIEGKGVPGELTEHRRPPRAERLPSRPPASLATAAVSARRPMRRYPDRPGGKSPARSSSKAWRSVDSSVRKATFRRAKRPEPISKIALPVRRERRNTCP